MPPPISMSCSRTYPVPLEDAFRGGFTTPLTEVFDRRYGPIPPIVEVDQGDDWGTPGATRTITTSDGGTMEERLLTVDAPHSFSYELTVSGGPLKPLIARVEGTWRFEAVGTGSRITWAWVLHPTSGAAAVPLRAFPRIWRGYARRALDRIEELILAS